MDEAQSNTANAIKRAAHSNKEGDIMEWSAILNRTIFLIVVLGAPFLVGAGLVAKYMGDSFRKKFDHIQSELRCILEDDQMERELAVDIDMGSFMQTPEEWIEEFLNKLNSGEIELKWALRVSQDTDDLILKPYIN
jgi:hypothetical protein